MLLENGKLLDGENKISDSTEIHLGFTNFYLSPTPRANPHAVDEIMNADMVVLGPGGLYNSLIPNLLVDGIGKALRETRAKKVLVINLINKHNQTPNFKVSDYLKMLEKFIGKDVWDHIVLSNSKPSQELIKIYEEEGSLVENDLYDGRVLQEDILSSELKEVQEKDMLQRNLIRHDSKKLARVLMGILNDI
jgi:uncharacterized cofD-like protein